MGIVLGPYDDADWFVMKQLRASLKHMAEDTSFYKRAIEKEKELFRMFRDKEVA